MDTKALIREAQARFDHNSAKQLLKEKYKQKLIIANQGGLWKTTPELIAFLDNTGSDEIILLDSYENPIKVKRQELSQLLRDTYNQVMTDWYTELQLLNRVR